MMDDDLDELGPEMITECLEALDEVEAALLETESQFSVGGDLAMMEVDRAFRGVHTIKGIAGFLEAHVIVEVAHRAESLLDGLRSGSRTVCDPSLGALAESVEVLRSLLTGWFEGDRDAAAVGPLLARLQALDSPTAPLASAPPVPPPPAAEAPPVPPPPAAAAPPVPPPPAAAAPPVPPPPAAAPPVPPPPAVPPAAATPVPRRARPPAGIRVPISKLDGLVNLVGELILAENSLLHHFEGADQLDQDAFEPLHRITRDLQDLVMSVRMVPIRSTFQRIRRVAMDIARKQNKKIQLVMEGGETEVDKTVIEAISDPLLHLVRNACDHGLRSAADRAAVGKAETGVLTLHARHESGEVQILIEDDGQGLDTERILAKAQNAGLVPPGHRPADALIHSLIFAPGLSTRDAVTEVSGRGVGMDVVQSGITGVGGSVEIDSVAGRGTRFLIRLPLTLAIVDGMLFERGGRTLAIPLTGIQELVPFGSMASLQLPGGAEMIDVLGTTVQLLDLSRELGPCEGGLLVILEDNHRLVAIRTDALIGQQQLVVKPMPPMLEGQFGWSGCTILSDGAIGLLLDVKSIVEHGVRATTPWEGALAG